MRHNHPRYQVKLLLPLLKLSAELLNLPLQITVIQPNEISSSPQ